MRRSISILTMAAIAAILSTAAFADVKVKSKQTVGCQSYENTTYIKGKRQRSETIGGTVTITQCDLKRTVQLNTNSHTYMLTPFTSSVQTTVKSTDTGLDGNGVVQTGGRITTTITTKDTGERKQMFGYTARRLIITIETVSSPNACNRSDTKMQTDGWYIDAAFALDCDGGYGGYGIRNPGSGGCQDKYDVKTVGTARRGFAVYEKTSMLNGNGRETFAMISEVVEFSQYTLDPVLFEVPRGFREVGDASQMYTGLATRADSDSTTSSSGVANEPAKRAETSPSTPKTLGPKKPGTIRIGLADIRIGAVGEGLTATELTAAVRNTLAKYMNVPDVEVIRMEAKESQSISTEATTKDCDFMAFLTVSHKKGGSGFGMFKSLAPIISSVIPLAGGSGSYVSETVASQGNSTALHVSAKIKAKDELTLDVRLTGVDGIEVLERFIKVKAKSNSEDIISLAVEQAARGILDSVKK